MKVEIVDVRPIQAATSKGTLEKRIYVLYRAESGIRRSIELPGDTIDREVILAAIKEHETALTGIMGEHEI